MTLICLLVGSPPSSTINYWLDGSKSPFWLITSLLAGKKEETHRKTPFDWSKNQLTRLSILDNHDLHVLHVGSNLTAPFPFSPTHWTLQVSSPCSLSRLPRSVPLPHLAPAARCAPSAPPRGRRCRGHRNRRWCPGGVRGARWPHPMPAGRCPSHGSFGSLEESISWPTTRSRSRS